MKRTTTFLKKIKTGLCLLCLILATEWHYWLNLVNWKRKISGLLWKEIIQYMMTIYGYYSLPFKITFWKSNLYSVFLLPAHLLTPHVTWTHTTPLKDIKQKVSKELPKLLNPTAFLSLYDIMAKEPGIVEPDCLNVSGPIICTWSWTSYFSFFLFF